MLPAWKTLDSKEIREISDMPNGVYGFVYELVFDDNTRYIGKKCVFSTRKYKIASKPKTYKGTIIGQVHKNVAGKKIEFNIVKEESNWKSYTGSSKQCKEKRPIQRNILEFAFTPLELTYIEAEYQFKYGVLFIEKYLNDNILGSFYKGRLDDLARRRKAG